jgi:hypothetical protein
MVAQIIFGVVFSLLVLAAYLLRCMWKEMKEQERENDKLHNERASLQEQNRVLSLQRDSWKAQFLKADEDLKYLQNWKL